MPRVFITGLGFITSIGNDAANVTRNLRELRHGFQLYPPFQQPEIPVKVAAPVREFSTDSNDCEDWTFPARYAVKREVLRGLAPHGLYAWCAMQQAIEDARLGEADVSNAQTGLYAASGGSPQLMGYMLNRMHSLGVMRCSPLGIVASIAGTVQFNLVAHFKIKGSSCGFASACASSSHALGFALDDLVLGRQKRMFVVGAEDGNMDAILPFAGMRALSLQTDPNLASRPFDVARDGFVGTAADFRVTASKPVSVAHACMAQLFFSMVVAIELVLEAEDEVARRGVKPYCEVLGWGQASDGHNVAISHPDGTGLRAAMENALRATGTAPEEVDYVNAHATSTPIGDVSEAKALKAIF